MELPSFDLAPPVIDIDAPTGTFRFAKQAYESARLGVLGETLENDLTSGGYGLDTDDEIRAWGRAVDRQESQRRQTVDEASRAFVSRRFSQPPGALFDAIDGVTQRASDSVSEVNREIAIKRSTDYIEARRFTITSATQLEQILIEQHAGIMVAIIGAPHPAPEEEGVDAPRATELQPSPQFEQRPPGLPQGPDSGRPGLEIDRQQDGALAAAAGAAPGDSNQALIGPENALSEPDAVEPETTPPPYPLASPEIAPPGAFPSADLSALLREEEEAGRGSSHVTPTR